MLYLFLLNCIASLLFVMFENPLSKGYMLLLLTIFTSLSASTLFMNSWFGYILFLIMVGGMLVAFIYMTSIASNEKFKFPQPLKILMFICLLMIILMSLMKSDAYLILKNHFILHSQEMTSSKTMHMNKIFSSPFLQIPLALMSYLFLTLIMVVKMTDFIKGPIRQK
uniref:NADH-ubiquinone oxidoreductase chain 6 n=1 Tax=Scolytinae sp. BMNH 1274291 TaxID=2558039 RepID=A0A126TFA3_9CUCU|nr:NADH dehydrogenase subunit 6 [Scolytinae sp. BMNH 1274291]